MPQVFPLVSTAKCTFSVPVFAKGCLQFPHDFQHCRARAAVCSHRARVAWFWAILPGSSFSTFLIRFQ